jgi:DNA excision repair protein ERCC-6
MGQENDDDDEKSLGGDCNYGAVSVKHASAIEGSIRASMAGEPSGQTIASTTEEDVQGRILGLEREIWALRTSGMGFRDGLQQAVMKERLKTLENEHAGLVARLGSAARARAKKRLDMMNAESRDDGFASARGAGQRHDAEGTCSAGTGTGGRELGTGTVSKGKKRQQAPKDDSILMEVDLFEDVRPKKGGGGGALIETERDRLIRLGVLTPFDNLGDYEKKIQGDEGVKKASIADVGMRMLAEGASKRTAKLMDPSQLPRPQRAVKRVKESYWREGAKARLDKQKKAIADKKRESGLCSLRKERNLAKDDQVDAEERLVDKAGCNDDMDDAAYHMRQIASQMANDDEVDDVGADAIDADEPQDVSFQGGYRIPADIYSKLFDYQRTSIKWLWELHTQKAGGIMGDEMGLGKTVQITAFLAGLHHSGLFRPSLIVCPATMLRQWLRELREWYPPFRVAILHESARSKNSSYSRAQVVARIATARSGILLTTYDQMRICKGDLGKVNWGYVVLDEGHKIRNPDAEVTLAAKQMRTSHRLIMSGSPIQNRLVELWSLFDFVFPGKLGTLPVFQAQFAIPIQQGGYANASSLQVATAYKCAVVLRDMISPYLLRRKKADVAKALPKKTERILFCSLTNIQRDMYMSYLQSKELSEILNGDRGALIGIDILRKICNHPDLLDKNKWDSSVDYGNPERSGKMLVLDKILKHWVGNQDKALVFAQTQQTLDILEKMVIERGWTYHRMDGSTSVATRSSLIDDFNSNPHVSLFLLTTRVGGLGINLVGASKCVIFDPDWNPSTDVQARERAWRIGQTKEVTVYRLILSGTIEEKVYHRQVYKQFMTDKVLKDPRQKRFFKAKDLSDLFTLGDEYAEGTETAAIFSSLGPAAAVNGPMECLDEPSHPNDTINESKPENVPENGDHLAGARVEDFKGAEPNGNNGTHDVEQQGDASILKELFEHGGMHSALDHDKIEGAHKPGNNFAQKEARKIAERAAKALRDSRKTLMATPVHVPTWTGRSGGAPLFGNSTASNAPNITNSSSALLQKIRARNADAASPDIQNPEIAAGKQLADRIVAFLRARGGSAPSSVVAAKFKNDMGDVTPGLFRCILQEVAVLRRMVGGRQWTLKGDY